MSTTLTWRGLDAPRMEIARVTVTGSTLRARGTQIGAGYELRYELGERTLDVEVVDGSRQSFDLEDADFFDLGYSPLFNSLPVLRDGLLSDPAQARDYVMRWVSVPDLSVERSEQRYEPMGERRVRFIAADYRAVLQFDADGFIESYEGLAIRVGF